MLTKQFGAILFTLACGLLTACAGADYSASSLPAEVATRPIEYRVGPGDSLEIFVWDHEDLSTVVQVRPDGKISTPLVEDLQAAGKSSTALARDIEDVLQEYVRSPVVTVIVQSFVGTSQQQVRVVGQAVQPQAIQYRQGMTVMDVMFQVGGLTEFADGNDAKVVRDVKGRSVEIAVNLDDLLNDGQIEENIRMLPGDVLVIPESFL